LKKYERHKLGIGAAGSGELTHAVTVVGFPEKAWTIRSGGGAVEAISAVAGGWDTGQRKPPLSVSFDTKPDADSMFASW
jgi:hypothetical protein